MKIVIDMRMYGSRIGGLGRYNEKLLEYLVKQDSDHQYVLILRKWTDDFPKLPKNFSVKVCNCKWYSFKEQFVLPFVLKKLKPDLVHFTHFNVPVLYKGKFVVTIHDLIMTKFPSRRASRLNTFMFAIKNFFYEKVIRHAVKKSTKIITVSDFTAQDVIEHFELSEEESKKVQTVYNGLTVLDKKPTKKLELPEKFFVYIGNAYPHKNLDFLIQVFCKFVERYPDYYLILAGTKNYFYQKLEQQVKDCKKSKHVIFPGYASDEDLIQYYSKATAYIFPSLYEGFGLPPLEAMACKLPVLSSNSSCLPEVLGDSVLYFDPNDEEELLRKMNIIVKDEALREELIDRGLERIKLYSWDKMAKEILEIYNS